jgi:hypothetical protein
MYAGRETMSFGSFDDTALHCTVVCLHVDQKNELTIERCLDYLAFRDPSLGC